MAARSDALGLLPRVCFDQHRVDRQIALTKLSIVSDPESIREVFASKSQNFELSNLHLRILKPSLGNGLIVAQGNEWRRLRRASLAMIRRNRQEQSTQPESNQPPLSAARDFARHQGTAPDFPERLSRLVMDLLATDVLGHANLIASPEITDAIERHRSVSERVDLLDMFGVSPSVPSPKMRKATRIAATFDHRILGEIGSAPKSPPGQVRPDEYRDLIVNLLTGFESLWLTCVWSLLILAHNPPLLRWLRSAGDETTRQRRMHRVALEVLRLYPPLPLIYRKPLSDVELASGPYARGQLLCVSPYVVHRHRLNWDEPDTFAMDRPLSAYRDLPFMPFGVGARRCVGAPVSLPLITDVLTGLLDGHDPVSEASMPIPRMGLSLRPQGSYALNLVRR